jgi:hypothetical protein
VADTTVVLETTVTTVIAEPAVPSIIISSEQGPPGSEFDPNIPQPQYALDYGTFSSTILVSTSAGQHQLDSFQLTSYGAAKYLLYATAFGKRQICELLILHDGVSVVSTEYAMMATVEPLGQYSFIIQDNFIKLLVECPYADITYKVIKTLINN